MCSHVYNDYGFIIVLLVQLLQAMYHVYTEWLSIINTVSKLKGHTQMELHKIRF